MVRTILGVGLALIALAAFATGCSDDNDGGGEPTSTAAEATAMTEPTATAEVAADPEAAAVEAVVAAYAEAWNASDAEGLIALFTDAGLQDQFLRTREETATFLPVIIANPPITIGPFSDTQVDGTTATTTTDFYIGIAGSPQTFTLVNEGGTWLIDDQTPITGPIPDDAPALDLAMTEYAYDFDASAVSADMAFNVSNDGAELHEIEIFAVPEDAPLESAMSAEGSELLGLLFGVEPGTQATLAFSDDLAAGRYVLVCFIPAPDGQRHSQLGMLSEFTVE